MGTDNFCGMYTLRIATGIILLALLLGGGVNISGASISQDIDRISLPPPSEGFFGWSVTSGDFNGDDLADVVVSDPVGDSEVYVYYGNNDFPIMPDQILIDTCSNGHFGDYVASASFMKPSDTNNDGFDDLAMNCGVNKVCVYMSTSEGLENTPNMTLTPPNGHPEYGFGHGISMGGDINGDGFADILIAGGCCPKYVCVYHGSASGINATPNSIFTYPNTGIWSGVSIVGDLNADGFDDIAVSVSITPPASDFEVYVYDGSAEGIVPYHQIINISIPILDTFRSGQVAPAGDLNGDGFADLLIGNQWADDIYEREGKAYIFYGSSSELSNSPDVIIDNPYPEWNVRFGHSLGGIGDFNYDGFDDMVIGSPYAGAAYIYYGSSTGVTNIPSLTLDEEGVFGWAVSHVGDIKGNGQNFIVIGEEFGGAYLYALTSAVPANAEALEIRGNVVNISGAQTEDLVWDAYNFGAFWYDLDDDQVTETMTIAANTLIGPGTDRTIDDGNLTYQTAPVYREYEVYENEGLTVDGNTGYYLEGWIGAAYVAINGSADKLCKLLVEVEDYDGWLRTEGKEWDLGGGFTLVVDQIELIDEKARFTLMRNGSELDNKTVSSGDVYVYTAEIGGESDVPVFSCYMDAVHGYGGINRTWIKYVFLIDDGVMEIECGSEYGAMEVMTANASQIVLENDYSFNLGAGETKQIMGDLCFVIADDDDFDVIRFYPYVEHTEPMTYEIRGEVQSFVGMQSTDVAWDAYNFGAFWYDLDDDLMTETMTIAANTLIGPNTDRTIDENCLSYQTSPVYQEYEVYEHEGLTVDGNTGYYLELIGERYVALNGSTDKLCELLIEFEDDEEKTLCTGEEWYLGEGLSIVVMQSDCDGRKVWFRLNKDGSEVDDVIVSEGEVYTYTKDICVEDDVPVFSCYVDDVFRGTDSNVVRVKYVFLIDDYMMGIDCGNEFGAMKVVYENSSQIILKNYEPISLVEDSERHIMGDLYFKTADDTSAIRFYPFTKVTISEDEPDTIPAVDSDCDGVPDAWDEEPDTPDGYYTDSHGQGQRWGDMNGDGKLTSVDALMILQAAAEAISL